MSDKTELLNKIRHRYLWIPVELCALCLKKRFITGLQIYILLKAISDGKVKINRKLKLQLAKILDVSERTINNNLKKLIQRNWVGYNAKTKTYYIRAFHVVSNIERFKSKFAAEFRVVDIKFQKTGVKDMKAFTAGTIVGYCARLASIKKRRWLRVVRLMSAHISSPMATFPNL